MCEPDTEKLTKLIQIPEVKDESRVSSKIQERNVSVLFHAIKDYVECMRECEEKKEMLAILGRLDEECDDE